MIYLEKFLSLPVEKQNKIIDAAFKCFGSNGYKKASASDIATAAGVSKATVFRYFGTKKALYLYLLDLCGNIVLSESSQKLDSEVTDLFERIKHATNVKVFVMKKHPEILTFLSSVYHENDDEVKNEVKDFFAKGEDFRKKNVLCKIDTSKFKDDINVDLVMKTLAWFAEGFINSMPGKEDFDFEEICREFNDCMDLFKSNFYKKEYL